MMALECEEEIDAFESELIAGRAGIDDVRRYLPSGSDQQYLPVLVELLRITLEHQWRPGEKDALGRLQAAFPEVFADKEALGPLAYEEYRLRAAEGQCVERDEYARRYGIDVSHWQEIARQATQSDATTDSAALWDEFSIGAPGPAANLALARRLLPEAGSEFGPFKLICLLGQGAFGKVFLARQATLANRHVALKITSERAIEADRLARMQHSNIVPVYSVHRRGRLSAVCMPYLGNTTLADLIATLKREPHVPLSGHSLVDTVAAKQSELSTVGGDRVSSSAREESDGTAPSTIADSTPHTGLGKFASRPLEDVIVWLVSRVAAGLAHAHERGITHRDLKPANILVAKDGEPLILDFNLAVDHSAAAAHMARLGGTLPYMAPEQLRQFQDSSTVVDARSDIYSLGVVMYETLTRQLPFPVRRGPLEHVVQAMSLDRRECPPNVCKLNPAVSQGVGSIVDKCLAVKPEDRYQKASELQEDLERQLTHHPLRFAPEQSSIEVARKWCRRHPRITSATSVALFAVLLATLAGTVWFTREQRLAQRMAEEAFRDFHESVPNARVLLVHATPGRFGDREAATTGRKLLEQYRVLSNPHWISQPAVQRLSPESRTVLAADVADMRSLLHRLEPNVAGEDAGLQAAHADLLLAASVAARRSSTEKLVSTLAALRRGSAGDIRDLERIALRDTSDPTAWIVLGDCRRLAGDLSGADAACTAAIALKNDLYLTWYYRGLVRLEQNRAVDAESDLSEALTRRAEFPGGFANRGIARQKQGKYQEAIEDLSRAIDLGVSKPLLYFVRARCYEALGDREAARLEMKAATTLVPLEERDWFERGMAHVRLEDYTEAENDFAQAAALLPHYIDALRNLAHVRSEKLNKTEAAIETLGRLLDLRPNDVSARISRGVLFARLGQKEPALADAKAVLGRQPPPLAIYQAACIYALLGKDDERSRQTALYYLQQSLLQQRSLSAAAKDDADLANIRQEPRYTQLMAGLAGSKSATLAKKESQE